MTVKLSVSLPDADAAFIDKLAELHSGNRSAAVQDLVRLGRELRAVDAYAAAFEEWDHGIDAGDWDVTVSDGLDQ
ncbi:ribbon-helix-helix domain-containing protein [Cryobacterium sp. PH31-L1]|uniref:ribbon-helix-helix domain-containing protein n=1 Tax=Cryobacterium sp. PH31-L1 TaxID=3046199 RepID=UPI0024B9BF59|nr:ribbon-helix-helix domain-containing protein [Cryobacterium sp. PH31-L1]MDJ0378379.1 ribbon-helix-helix domain-containing protein [Cryobacterium sp. PH31-L1]